MADLRASTPSNAAELAVPDMAELKAGLASARSALCRMMEQKLENLKKKLGELASKREFRDPLAYIEDKRLLLDYMQRRMAAAGNEICRKDRERFAAAAAALDAMSPLKVLGRGYAIVTNDAGKVICRSSDAAKGDAVHVTLGRGRLLCRVEGEENEGKEAEF